MNIVFVVKAYVLLHVFWTLVAFLAAMTIPDGLPIIAKVCRAIGIAFLFSQLQISLFTLCVGLKRKFFKK